MSWSYWSTTSSKDLSPPKVRAESTRLSGLHVIPVNARQLPLPERFKMSAGQRHHTMEISVVRNPKRVMTRRKVPH